MSTPISATMVVAITEPMPGMASSRVVAYW